MKLSKLTLPLLTILFLMFGIILYKDAMPQHKEERIYTQIQKYNPYVLEKRVGGLTILNKLTGEKQKPSNSEVFKVYDMLTKEWGRTHVKIVDNSAIIKVDNDSKIVKLPLENQKELIFVKTYYGATQ